MKETGTIIDFTDDGKAVVELQNDAGACSSCPSASVCKQGEENRLTLDCIPGVAVGTEVYVEVGHRSLLKMPTLAYLMLASFLFGAALGQIVLKLILSLSQADMGSILLGLVATAATIVGISMYENKREEEELIPRIVGVKFSKERKAEQ
jgi:positive regulator of sigma E activity